MSRIYAVVVAMVITSGLAGCAGAAEPTPAASEPSVIDHRGLPGIPFGADRADLESRHGLSAGPGDCAPRLPDHPEVSPVFDDDRLVLMWANPPLQTPEGIAVGSPVQAVRDAHPDAEVLTAPAGTHQFDGLLVPAGEDKAYLFLQDGTEVRKLIVGYTRYLRLLFDEGFGTC